MSNRGKVMHEMNTAKALDREGVLKKILRRMKKHNIKPQDLTAISEFAAEQMAQEQGKPCSASTLRRNSQYRSHIKKFMKQMGYEDTSASESTLELQLRIRELIKENEILEKQLGSAFEKNALLEHQVTSTVVETAPLPLPSTINEDLYYRILLQMINSIGYELDIYGKRVHDDLENRTIFDNDDLPGFFIWHDRLRKP